MQPFSSVVTSLNIPPARQPQLNNDLVSRFETDYKVISDGLNNEEIFEIAERITLADLLENPACSVEVLSMIRNVLHYAYVFPSPVEGCEINKTFNDINDIVPNRVFKTAFEMLKQVKSARSNNALPRRNNVLTFCKKELERPIKVVVPCAPQLDKTKAEEQVQAWINKCRKENITNFQAEDLQKFVEENYLCGLQWSNPDKEIVGSNVPRWKQVCSTALQRFQEKKEIIYRKGRWVVVPD